MFGPCPTLTSVPVLECRLQEVAGTEGIVRVHVPFSLSDLSQISKTRFISRRPDLLYSGVSVTYPLLGTNLA